MAPMRWTLPASFMVHAAILIAAVVVLPHPDRFEVEEQESIPVDIVSIEDFSKRQAVSKDVEEPKPEEKVAPPKVEEAEKPKPAPEPAKEIKEAALEPEAKPEPIPEPELKPESKPAEAPPPDPQPLEELIRKTDEPKKAEAVPLPKKKPEPPKKPEKKQPKFDVEDVAALLNKIDDTRKAPPKPTEETGKPKKAEFTSLTGADDRLSADLVDALRRRIESCWILPAGARDAQDLQIKLQISLNIDGTLANYPEIVNSSLHPAFDAAARSAQSAVKACEPYDFLPLEKYDSWRDIILKFDPSRMLATN